LYTKNQAKKDTMFNRKDKLRSLIDQAERLMVDTDDVEWKEDLQRAIELFKRMLEDADKEEISNE
jgi:hypothetical protein